MHGLIKAYRIEPQMKVCKVKIIMSRQMRQQLYFIFFFMGFAPLLPSDILADIIVVYLIC